MPDEDPFYIPGFGAVSTLPRLALGLSSKEVLAGSTRLGKR